MNPPAKSCCDARLFASPADHGSHVIVNHGKEAYAAFLAAGAVGAEPLMEGAANANASAVARAVGVEPLMDEGAANTNTNASAVARAVGAEPLMEGAANTNASASASAVARAVRAEPLMEGAANTNASASAVGAEPLMEGAANTNASASAVARAVRAVDERPMEMQAVDEALDGYNHAMRGVGKASEVLRDALDGAFRACYRDNAEKLAAVYAAAANMDFTGTKKRREGEGKVEIQDADKKLKDCAYWEEPPMSAEEKAADEADQAKWDEFEEEEEDEETMAVQASGEVIKDQAYWEDFYENPPMSAEEKAADEAHKARWRELEERVEASKKEDKRLKATKKEDQEVAKEEDEEQGQEKMEIQTSVKVINDQQAYYAPPISAEEKASDQELEASCNARGVEETDEDDEEETEEDEGEFSAEEE